MAIGSSGIDLLFTVGARDEASDILKQIGRNIAQEITQTLVASSRAVFDYSSKLEQVAISFNTLTGSAAASAKLLKDLQEFAKTTPFEFADLASFSQKLLGANVEIKNIIPLLRDVGNAVSAVGGSKEDIEGTVRAITQIISKGKVSAEEMNQLAERNINGFKILAAETGKTEAEIRRLAESGAITSDVFLKAFQRFSQTKWGDAMQAQSKTFAGSMSNIKDALLQTASTAFEPLYKQISGLAERFASELNRQGNDFKAAGKIIASYIGEGLGLGINAIAESFGKGLGDKIVSFFSADGSYFDNIETAFFKGLYKSFEKGYKEFGEWSVKKFKEAFYAPPPPIPQLTPTQSSNMNEIGEVVRPGEGGFAYNNKPDLALDEAEAERKKREKEAYEARINAAKIFSAEDKKINDDLLADLKRRHDLELGATGDFVKKRKDIAADNLKSQLASINIQREATKAATAETIGSEAERGTKLREFEAQEAEARREYNKEIQRTDDEAAAERLTRLRESFDRLNAQQAIINESRIAEITDQANREIITYAEAAKQIQAINARSIEDREKQYHFEFKLAQGNLAEQQAITAKLNQLKAESEAEAEESSRRRADALAKDSEKVIRQKENANRLADSADKKERDRIESDAEQKLITLRAYADQLNELDLRAANRREALINAKINNGDKNDAKAQAALLQEQKEAEAETANVVAANERRKQTAIRSTTETLKQFNAELRRSNVEAAQARDDAKQQSLETDLVTAIGQERVKILIQLQELELKAIDRRRDALNDELEDQEEKALKEVKNFEDVEKAKEEIRLKYKNLRDANNAQAEADKNTFGQKSDTDIQQANIDASGGGFLGGILGGAGIGAEELNTKLEPLKTIGNIIGSQFNAIAGAVGNAVKSFVLLGGAGGSMRKFTAEVLASIAQMATVQAIYELAQGLAVLALSYFGVPNAGPSATAHFASAAMFGAVAGATAIAGRAVAGDSFKNQTATGAGGGKSGIIQPSQGRQGSGNGGTYYSGNENGDDTRTREEGRLRGMNGSQSQSAKYELILPEGFAVREVEDAWRRRAPFRDLVIKSVNES